MALSVGAQRDTRTESSLQKVRLSHVELSMSEPHYEQMQGQTLDIDVDISFGRNHYVERKASALNGPATTRRPGKQPPKPLHQLRRRKSATAAAESLLMDSSKGPASEGLAGTPIKLLKKGRKQKVSVA